MKNNVIVTSVIIVLVGSIAFFGGMKHQQSKANAANPGRQFAGQGFHAGQNGSGGRQGFRPVAGEIIKSDETTITVKLTDGSSKIVLIGEKTTINTAAEAKREDLKTGITVAVFGSENADGTVTAQTVQLNPELRMRGLGGASPSADPKQ